MRTETRALWLGSLLLAVGCSGSDGDDDGPPPGATCASTSSSCGQTIAGALCTAANGGSCTQGMCSATGTCGPPPCNPLLPSSCSGETVCIGTTCESAFPRFYTITVGDITIADRDDNGDCWDLACGAPDPFVLVLVNGETVGVTAAKQDVYSAMFGDGFDTELVAGSEISVGIFDEDVTDNDLVLACFVSSLTAEGVRGRDFSCPGANSVSFSITPR